MKKIVIVGSPGAGKSTLAQALARILDTKVIHLDRYFWHPPDRHIWPFGWKEFSREDREKIEQRFIQENEGWIIEGTYMSSSDSRLYAADTIIFLDMPRFLCLSQAIKRYFKYHGDMRLDLPEGCTEQLSIAYILKILVFPLRGRKLFNEKIEGFRKQGTPVKYLEFTHENHKQLKQQIEMLDTHTGEATAEKLVLYFQSNKQVNNFLWKLSAKKQRDASPKKHHSIRQPNKQISSSLHELFAKKQEARAYEAPKPIPIPHKTTTKI